jgi:hypothetical protein
MSAISYNVLHAVLIYIYPMDNVSLAPVNAKHVMELFVKFVILVTIQLQMDHVSLAVNYPAKLVQMEYQQNASLATMDLYLMPLLINVNLIWLVIIAIVVLTAVKELVIFCKEETV